VKIYTSRVDSVATETGKLLSGLADSNSSKKKKDDEGEESEEEVEDEDGVVRKKTKKKVSIGFYPITTILTIKIDPTIIRSNFSTIICIFATKKIRARIRC
jgi:hypothetical protein